MLHIRKLLLQNFATHDKTEAVFPAKGLVAITGDNGAGKSSLLESVATSIWGESLRGEMGWRVGQAGAVTVTTDIVTVTRRRSKGGASKLEWDFWPDPKEVTYETTTKAQAALDVITGSYDVWRRTCVLSSLDSAAFSLARDSDRKKLLEEFLGLGMFDVALDACRKDKREALAKAQKAESERREVNLQLSFARQQLEQAQKDQATLLAETDGHDHAALKAEGQRVAQLVESTAKELATEQASLSKLEQTKAARRATLQHEEERLRRLGDACPTCGQNTEHAKAEMTAALATLKSKMKVEQDSLDRSIKLSKADIVNLQQDHADFSAQLTKLREQYALAASQAKQRAAISTKITESEKAVASWRAKLQAITSDTSAQDAATLEAVEQVLGLRGVRAQVLDHALGALEEQANAWLSRMPTSSGPLHLTVAGTTTQKSGSTVDAISLRVSGRSYASCSGGERRRVDVAILLALRELAVASHGRDGTLFCDEVFDALDQQGQADVAQALQEMSQDRLVVVISHSPELVKALRPSQHWHVSLKDGAAFIA